MPISSHKSCSKLLDLILIQMAEREKGKRWKNSIYPPNRPLFFQNDLDYESLPWGEWDEEEGKAGMKGGEARKIRGWGMFAMGVHECWTHETVHVHMHVLAHIHI